MKTFLAMSCALAVAGAAFGQGIYNEAIRQAHGAVNQTEAASQGATAQPPPPPAQNPPMNPVLAATMQNISSLRADFDCLSASVATSNLTNDLAAAAMGTTKASPASVAKLAGDLRAAIAGNAKIQPQNQQLAQSIHALFNSGQLTPAQRQMMENAVRTILQTGATPPDKIAAVEDDIQTVENETK